MIRISLVVGFAISCLASCASADVGAIENVADGISITRDVVYGEGLVDQAAGVRARDLLMDVYAPGGSSDALEERPAIILAFGGSFHRGDKGEGRYEEDGAQNSSMADYCRMFAHEGYVCFSIEYRLTQEDPVLARSIEPLKLMPPALAVTPTTTARIDFAREKMGLPKLDNAGREKLWRAILAASEDMTTAVEHVRTYSDRYNVAPDRLAIGGFSAGAITAINAAYGANTPVKAVVSLSGSSWGYNLGAMTTSEQPPILMLVGQDDLPGIRSGSAGISALFDQKGIEYESAWVAGFGHFYPMGAITLAPDLSKASVSDRIIDFLDDTLKPKS
jgi:dienelactone hydrolase